MWTTPFHSFYKARELESYLYGADKLVPVYASSNIEIYPYQIAAANFALSSPYLKGAILCDEGSLGKTYEGMLVATQMWYEGKGRILIVVPTPLLYQWAKTLDERFTVPFFTIDNDEVYNDCLAMNDNPFMQDGIILTTYDFAAGKAQALADVRWDLSIFDEAQHMRRIYTGQNKGAAAIKQAVGDSFKLLLTATPLQTSIMDLYGLIHIIDETVFPDEKAFYSRYFRKPENYPELTERISRFCFRATRPQVATYVKLTRRIPITAEFTLTEKEQQLYDLLYAYLQKPQKIAYPKMDQYRLTMTFLRTFSSSTFAVAKTIYGAMSELETMHKSMPDDVRVAEELEQFRQMYRLADSITENAKGTELLAILKKGFIELKKHGANKKALVFTENRTTQKYLYSLLNSGEYKGKVLTYSGDKSRDYSVMAQFENEAQILITTDVAAEGFDITFCAFVINYDIPYNTLTIEQRILRCHRQNQNSDVYVVNFLNRNNYAEVRILELINKRVLQFDGIIGMSEQVIGNFGVDFSGVLATARTKAEIDKAWSEVLDEYENENRQVVEQAERSLFTTFSKEIADKVTVSPQYIIEKSKTINADLWELTKQYFKEYNEKHTDCHYAIDENLKTITAQDYGEKLPHLFYYWSGSRNRPYRSLRTYGMARDFKPHHGRITLTSVIGRGVINETECADTGTLTVDAEIEKCSIALYCVSIRPKNKDTAVCAEYNIFVGKTESGQILSDDDCKNIMRLPVLDYTEGEHRTAHWLKSSTGQNNYDKYGLAHLLDDDALIQQMRENEGVSALKDETERLRISAANAKLEMERSIDALRMEVATATRNLEKGMPRFEKLKAQKKLNALEMELRQKENDLFLDGIRLDLRLEEQIKELMGSRQFTVRKTREFVLEVTGIKT